MKPNLFHYATSERSQDAVLCWMAAWANPQAAQHDPLLHELGKSFLAMLFRKHNRSMPEIRSQIEVELQRKGIDILVTIDSSLVVCIEDKAGTVERSQQLECYLEVLRSKGYRLKADACRTSGGS